MHIIVLLLLKICLELDQYVCTGLYLVTLRFTACFCKIFSHMSEDLIDPVLNTMAFQKCIIYKNPMIL